MGHTNLVGIRFGRLTVISAAEDKVSAAGYHTVMWVCLCDCGKHVVVRGKCLTQGATKSCGCLQREEMSKRASKHGGFGGRLYTIWNSMRQRCYNPNNNAYHNYGGRGISICSEWNNFAVFREWAYSTGYKEDAPRGAFTIDRIDVDGDYSPNNCRWSSMKDQSNNKRGTLYLEYNYERKPLSEWASIIGVDYTTIWRRYHNGLSTSEILNQYNKSSNIPKHSGNR